MRVKKVKYRYPDDVPEDVYRRHDNCTCTVTYESGRQRQDVWSKKTWTADEETLAQRRDFSDGKPTVFTKEQAAAKEREVADVYAKKVDIPGESGIINNRECDIAPDKINKFFLKPDAKHFQDFFDVGYKETDFERLDKDLRDCFDYKKAVDNTVSDSGVEKFSIFTELGVDKKKRFRTVWQEDTPDSTPRIITDIERMSEYV